MLAITEYNYFKPPAAYPWKGIIITPPLIMSEIKTCTSITVIAGIVMIMSESEGLKV